MIRGGQRFAILRRGYCRPSQFRRDETSTWRGQAKQHNKGNGGGRGRDGTCNEEPPLLLLINLKEAFLERWLAPDVPRVVSLITRQGDFREATELRSASE